MQQFVVWLLLVFVFLADLALALVNTSLPSSRSTQAARPGSPANPESAAQAAQVRGGLMGLFFILLVMAFTGLYQATQGTLKDILVPGLWPAAMPGVAASLLTMYFLFIAWVLMDASRAVGQECPRPEHTRLRQRLFWLYAAMNALLLTGLGLLLGTGMKPPTATELQPLIAFMALDGVKIALVFIALLGVYPLAFIAYRQVYSNLHQERLEEEFKLLGIYTEDEARRKVRELYGIAYSLRQYLWFILLILLFSTLILVVFAFIDQMGSVDLSRIGMNSDVRTLIFYAYLGAYVFSVQELIRRYNTEDLRPQVFSSILGRMLVATVVVFVSAQVLINTPAYQASQTAAAALVTPAPTLVVEATPAAEESAVEPAGTTQADETASQQPMTNPPLWAAFLAFFIGIFPQSGIQWLQNLARNSLNTLPAEINLLPLRNLQGISMLHAARLEEMGIDDVQNLATADIRKLLLITRFDTHQIINWIDQAILYAKVGAKYQSFKDENIYSIYQLITRIRQLEAVREAHFIKNGSYPSPDELSLLTTRLKISMGGELQSLIDPSDYPNFAYIRAYYRHSATLAAERAAHGRRGLSDYAEDSITGIEEEYRARVEEYRELVKVDPCDFETWSSLGMFLSKLDGQWQEAYDALGRASRLEPTSANTFANLAVACYKLNRMDEAIQNATRAITLNPNDKFSYLWRGKIYLTQGDRPKAKADFDQAICLDDHYGEAYLRRGVVFNGLGEFKKAAGDFELAYWLLSERNEVTLWSEWGFAYMQLGDLHHAAVPGSGDADYRLAVDKLTHALALLSDAGIYYNRGMVHTKLHDWYHAIVDFIKSIDLYHQKEDIREFQIRYQLGLAYWVSERKPEACAEFKIAVEKLAAETPEAIAAQKFMKEAACGAATLTPVTGAAGVPATSDQPAAEVQPAPPQKHAALLEKLAVLGFTPPSGDSLDLYIDSVLGDGGLGLTDDQLAIVGEKLSAPVENVRQASLMTIASLGQNTAGLLAKAGVKSARDLAGRDATALHPAVVSANAQARLLDPDPDMSQVSDWVETAKTMVQSN